MSSIFSSYNITQIYIQIKVILKWKNVPYWNALWKLCQIECQIMSQTWNASEKYWFQRKVEPEGTCYADITLYISMWSELYG